MSCGRSAVVERQYINQKVDKEISKNIESLLISSEVLHDKKLAGESIYAPEMLRRFYKRQNHMPVWSSNSDILLRAKLLTDTIMEVPEHGLNSEFYHLTAIRKLIDQIEQDEHADIQALTALDLLLTDAFLKIGQHLSSGCIDPVSIEVKWFVLPAKLAMDVILDDALKDNSIRESLLYLLPHQQRYEQLKKRLEHYRDLAADGGWPSIHLSILLKRGVNNGMVRQLRKRLIASGDMKDDINIEAEYFDGILEQAVKSFQKRHALKPDGIVGPDTVKEMNISARKRLRQMEVNLERMRWMSRSLGHRYIEVNIADFRLNVHEYGHTVLSMDVVVGKPFWYTPVFSDLMTHLIINPLWNIPESIAREEIIPRVKSDLNYLSTQSIKIVKNWFDTDAIDAETINWSEVAEWNFPYKFRQEAGVQNPLGQIKFMFPNNFNVYLHDTPVTHLFSKSSRAFSHGCIRVRRPVALTEYLMKDDPGWTRSQILDAINSGQTMKVYLPNPLSVHLVYLTSWVDDEGTLQFRNDIYGRDERVDIALLKSPSFLNHD